MSAIHAEIHAKTSTAQVEAGADSSRRIVPLATDESAYKTFWRWQRPALVFIAIVALGSLILRPLDTLVVFVGSATVAYFAIIVFRFFATYRAEQMGGTVLEITQRDLQLLGEDNILPVYTILCPLYHEAEGVVQFLRGLTKLDYPFDRLDIRVLLEADDLDTQEAAYAEKQRMGNPPSIRIIVVPESDLKTKPRACNYGLVDARGDYVVIYDAEDVPEPDQLRKALVAFTRLPERTVCVQAKLNYYNADQNLLTGFFTAEYSAWFDLFLPGLCAVGAPIPLGGTSNHFKAAALYQLGGWDPYNVTEDADLGIRIARRGMSTAVIDSTTWEEANPRVGNWIRQRSRWVKGYMQTWLVAMRQPRRLLRTLGFWRFLCFQATIGGTPFVLLLNPIYWAFGVLYVLTARDIVPLLFPAPIFAVSVLAALVGNLLFVYLSIFGLFKRQRYGLVPLMFLSPLYWVLQSIAAWKALYQLMVKPHYWEKTTHNLSSPSGRSLTNS